MSVDFGIIKGKLTYVYWIDTNSLKQWFSNYGMRTTGGALAFLSGTQRFGFSD